MYTYVKPTLVTIIVLAVLSCTSTQKDKTMDTADTLALTDFSSFYWIHTPKQFKLAEGTLEIQTEPHTDYWQRTYYGFQNDNAPTYVRKVAGDFSFSVRTDFDSKCQFDQCGIILYQNSDNWLKASIEYEDDTKARLGSVVTNLGFSDWSTTDISPKVKTLWYRLSRKSQDFFIESSEDGKTYKQMRVLHMHQPIDSALVGVYACSPNASSFTARFSDFRLGASTWKPHEAKH